MKTFREWIDAKGVETLAVVLDQREGTIRMWKTRNHVPYSVWPDIMVKIPEVGLSDLNAMKSASKGG